MFEVMAEVEKISPEKEVEIEATAKDVEQLFVAFLNELLTIRDTEWMLFSKFDIVIKEESDGFYLTCKAYGEEIDQEMMPVGTWGKLNDIELKAIWMFLQTLPPVETHVGEG